MYIFKTYYDISNIMKKLKYLYRLFTVCTKNIPFQEIVLENGCLY
jgi:hypothetical protein